MSGELAVGKTVTALPGEWLEGASASYQWLADGVPIPGATADRLALTTSLAGVVIEVAVTGRPPAGESMTRTSTSGLRVATAGTPTLSGTLAVGSTLTARSGTWTPSTAFAYQWLADGQPIAGATRSNFLLTAAQGGKTVSVRVTGQSTGYPTLDRTSAATAKRVMNWSQPTISGTVAYLSTLTARAGTWTPSTGFTYQWYANDRAITGATTRTLKLGTAQKDKTISVRVTGRKSGHTTVVKRSAATGKVMTAPRPTISGSAVHGSTVTAKTGTWTSSTTRSYQWYADGVAISGATGTTLKLGSGQKDKAITVKVTGRRSGYATVGKTSAGTLRVQTAPRPTISGSPKVTNTLTAKRGTWSTSTTFSYQWYASGVAITGATSSTLKLSSSRVGKTIKVKVTGRKSGYPTVSRTSSATSSVTYPLRTEPVSSWNCPSWAPIKGNADSMIYHLPHQRFYDATKPEDCFRTESAAVNAGYRRAKV